MIGLYAAKSLKNAYDIPIVATIHATEAGRNSGIHDETQRYINDTEWLLTYEATEVIVNSNYMKNEIQRLFGLPFDKINVIPNGINLSNFTGIERDYDFRRQYAMDNEKIILYVGRLVYEKGVQHLIAAMPKILSNYHDAKLIIAGRGGMMDELRAEASNLGLNDKIYFTGYLNSKQVQKMYKCADVAVFPSTYEPFGIVALEAMLAGVPTVVSDVGGLDEIVTHGVDGMKSYAGNANSIADSVTALLYDHQLATNVSKKAKQKVKDQFNWEKIAQDTHFTYEKAICQTMAERQAKQMLQEKAKKTEKAENSQKEITNLLSLKIYDDAHKLAKQIRESKEYREYKELKENIESNPVKKAQVEEFEHLRYKIQVETMQGSGNATEAKQMLQEKYAELLKDEEIKKYFDAEIQFNVMIADVNKIIAEAVKDAAIKSGVATI